MPRNVRNFWLELNVDGSKTSVETGPRSKDGGFSLTILQRSGGGIVRAMEVYGLITDDGRIVLRADAKVPQVADSHADIHVETRR